MQVDAENRGTGEAYVEFVRPDDAEKALYKNRQMMGHRYLCVCVCVCYTALCTGVQTSYGHFRAAGVGHVTLPGCWPGCWPIGLIVAQFTHVLVECTHTHDTSQFTYTRPTALP